MKILLLGANGFIGSHLARRIVSDTNWQITGFDIRDERINRYGINIRFKKGDIFREHKWLDAEIRKCDVVIPLIAVATPRSYLRDPVFVYELDFEQNISIVKACASYGKRIIFPSSSEVYGFNDDEVFAEDNSNFVTGPVNKQRWIYANCKQLLDRVIWAYGQRDGLQFSIFRPFNWVGPDLDDIFNTEEGASRVITQFIANTLQNRSLKLVDGGNQKRCFTWIDDGIDCLMDIIENRNGVADGQIINIGSPANNCSIRYIAEYFVSWLKDNRRDLITPKLEIADSQKFYGNGYQDLKNRVPSIAKAQALFLWQPKVGIEKLLDNILIHYFLPEGL